MYFIPILHGNWEFTLTFRAKSSEIEKFTFGPKNGDGNGTKVAAGMNNNSNCLN